MISYCYFKNIIKYSFTWWINVFICTTSMLLHELPRILQENAVKPAQDCKHFTFFLFLKINEKHIFSSPKAWNTMIAELLLYQKLLFQLDLTASNAIKLRLSHSSVKSQQYFTEWTMIFSEGFTWRAENDQLSSSEKSSFIKKIWLQCNLSSFSNETSTSYQHHKLNLWELALHIRLTNSTHLVH